MIRKFISIVVIIVLLFCLTSCGSSSAKSNTTTKSNVPTITGKWISDGELLEITNSSFKFSTGDVWKYRLVNDYQIEITNSNGQTVVAEYSLSQDFLTLGGLSTGSISFSRDY